MPAYIGSGRAQLVLANRTVYLFNQESFALGTASIAFMLDRVSRFTIPSSFSVAVGFSAAPGTFEFDVEGSDIDTDQGFSKLGAGITTVNAGNNTRFDGTGFYPKFVRVRVVALANSGTVNYVTTLTR